MAVAVGRRDGRRVAPKADEARPARERVARLDLQLGESGLPSADDRHAEAELRVDLLTVDLLVSRYGAEVLVGGQQELVVERELALVGVALGVRPEPGSSGSSPAKVVSVISVGLAGSVTSSCT